MKVAIVLIGVVATALVALVLIGPISQRVDPGGPERLRAANAATAAAKPAPTLARPANTPAPLPSIGSTARAGNWEISLVDVKTADRLGQTAAQGVFAIVTIDARNLHRETSTLNSHDFQVVYRDGTRYESSTDGTSALLGTDPEVLLFGTQIQPGLTKRFRVVFDLNPAWQEYVLHAAEIRFYMPL